MGKNDRVSQFVTFLQTSCPGVGSPPTDPPTTMPTKSPTTYPTEGPTAEPNAAPTSAPTAGPTPAPSSSWFLGDYVVDIEDIFDFWNRRHLSGDEHKQQRLRGPSA